MTSRFAPTQTTVKPGEAVRFVVTNNDPFLHNFVSQEAGIPFLNLPGNTTQTVTWTAPAQTGAAIAVNMRSMEGFQMVMNFLNVPLLFLSGAFFPLRDLPTWLAALVRVQSLHLRRRRSAPGRVAIAGAFRARRIRPWLRLAIEPA